MNTDPPMQATRPLALKVFGVGDVGMGLVDLMIADGLPPAAFVAVNTGGSALENSAAGEKVRVESKRLRGLGSGGDPERGRQAAEENSEQLKALCEGNDLVFILAGLGGGAGTGISPVLARTAKAAGALVLAFATTPFECEGSRRQSLAQQGLEELKDAADGVICLHNQKIFKLIEENTSVVDTFKITSRLLADGVHGVWRLLTFKGLIEIHLEDICRLLQDRHCESAFAVVEASGPDRLHEVIEKLFTHPLLDNAEALAESEAVLVSLTGGPNLTMAEVNRVMEQVNAKCEGSQVIMGAGIDERFQDRLAVTVITAKRLEERRVAPRSQPENLGSQLLDRTATAKPHSRFLPPPPALPPEQVQQMLARQTTGRSAGRKGSTKMRQGQLPLELLSKGRFDKSEPTIHKGEDLDVPTYIRRGIALN